MEIRGSSPFCPGKFALPYVEVHNLVPGSSRGMSVFNADFCKSVQGGSPFVATADTYGEVHEALEGRTGKFTGSSEAPYGEVHSSGAGQFAVVSGSLYVEVHMRSRQIQVFQSPASASSAAVDRLGLLLALAIARRCACLEMWV